MKKCFYQSVFILLLFLQVNRLLAQDGLFIRSPLSPMSVLALLPGEDRQIFFAPGNTGAWFDFGTCRLLKSDKLPEGWKVDHGSDGEDPPRIVDRSMPTNGKIKLDLNYDGVRILNMLGSMLQETPVKNFTPLCAAFSADGKRLYVCFVNEIWTYETETLTLVDKLKYNSYWGRATHKIIESPNPDKLILFDDVYIKVWDRLKKAAVDSIAARWTSGPQYDAVNSKIYLFNGRKCFVLDHLSLDTIGTYEDRVAAVVGAQSLKGSDLIAMVTKDGITHLWNWKKNKLVATLVIFSDNSYVVYTPDNYYMCNRGFTGIALRQNGKVRTFQEIDIERNRPDLVLSAIGLADEQTLADFKSVVTKRIELKGAEKQPESIPGFELDIRWEQKLVSADSIFALKITTGTSSAALKSLHVLVNETPIFGKKGLALTAAETQNLDKQINLLMANGNNFIEVFVENVKGEKSFRRSVQVFRTGTGTRNLHLVCVGISKYQSTSLKYLKNARTDAEEVARLFQSRPGLFDNVYSYLYFDQRATKANIVSLPPTLAKCSVNDVVIFFFAGHGVNIDEPIFCTYDMEFSEPYGKGIKFNELYDWMVKIPARQKLLITDACAMGELDSKAASSEKALNTIVNSDPSFVRGQAAEMLAQTQFDLVKATFMDIRRNYPGVVIIPSTKATETAPDESLFQDSLVNALTLFEGKKAPTMRRGAITLDYRRLRADLNEDGTIMANELLQHLSAGKKWEEYLFYDFPVWQSETGLWQSRNLNSSRNLNINDLEVIAAARNYDDLRKGLQRGWVVHGGELMYFLVSRSSLQKEDYQRFFQKAEQQYGGKALLFGDQKSQQRIIAATFQSRCNVELLEFLLQNIDVPINLQSALFNPEGQGMMHNNFRITCREVLDLLLKRGKITQKDYQSYLAELKN